MAKKRIVLTDFELETLLDGCVQAYKYGGYPSDNNQLPLIKKQIEELINKLGKKESFSDMVRKCEYLKT